MIIDGGRHSVRGRATAVLQDGVALFDSLYAPPVDTEGQYPALSFVLRGLASLDVRYPRPVDQLRVVDFLVNGHLVRDSLGTVRVRPGEAIEGVVRLRYATKVRSLLYMLAQTTTWGTPEADTLTVKSLLAGVSDARTTLSLKLRAPERPGDYWILWTHGAEATGVWLLSGTNWRCGRPRWGDGNELAAQPDSVLARAVGEGVIRLPYQYCNETEFLQQRPLALAGIRVEVRP